MDENADLRLTIETARKNKNWARRCYSYELAMEYFSLLEPDCYELCSYCDLIPEFLEEKNESCLTRALGAVKVFVNRCVDAPNIARAVTRVIIDKIFFSASTKVREIATDIILDFIEWEACNAVLKELITGALKYDGVRSDECIRVMRYALLDFGPHVISVYKLIDFIAALVRNKSFLSIEDECSQLLIVIYKCLGPMARVHLIQILDPDYISAIEDSYEEMRNIPIYHCRIVRYSKDNSPPLEDSDEEMFAACRIAEPTSHPSSALTDYGYEDMVTEGEGIVLDADQSDFWDFGREQYYRAADAGPNDNDNKGYWDLQILNNIANYQIDFGVVGANALQRNQIHVNAYDNVLAYDILEHANRADSIPELRQFPYVYPEPEQQGFQWNTNNVEQLNDQARSVSALDMACQASGYPLQFTNPFEVIMQKLMDKYGVEDVLYWLCVKLNPKSKVPLSGTGTNEPRKNNLPRKCKSLETFAINEDQVHNEARNSISNTSREMYLSNEEAGCSYEDSFHPKHVINTKEEENAIQHRVFPSVEKNTISNLPVLENKNENMMAEKVIPFESIILCQKYLPTNKKDKIEENVPGLVASKSQLRTSKCNLVSRFFQKIRLFSSKNKKTTSNIQVESRYFTKKFQFVFKEKQNYRSCHDPSYPNLIDNLQDNYFQDTLTNFSSKTENGGSYLDRPTNNCRNSYSTNRSSQHTVFSSGRQKYLNQNQIPVDFLSSPEEMQHNVCCDDFHSSSEICEENVDEEIICLSDSDSISEISPNLCCYSFQKNSIRKLASNKHEENSKGDVKTEHDKDKPGGHSFSGCHGSGVRRVEFERRNENTLFNLTTEGNTPGVISLGHRGSGDEASQPDLNRQVASEEPAPEEESQSTERSQKLFCCISMNDTNEQALQFGS